jgi:hypothetical protein
MRDVSDWQMYYPIALITNNNRHCPRNLFYLGIISNMGNISLCAVAVADQLARYLLGTAYIVLVLALKSKRSAGSAVAARREQMAGCGLRCAVKGGRRKRTEDGAEQGAEQGFQIHRNLDRASPVVSYPPSLSLRCQPPRHSFGF